MSRVSALTSERLRGDWPRWSLVAGIVALVICAIGGVFSPVAFFRAYLAAYVFCLGFALGSMALLMVYHLTGGSWGLLIRRILEAGMKTLPLLVLLFLPIAAGLGYLYVWAQPDIVEASPKLQYQQFYLRPAFYLIRAAVYFVVWLATAFVLTRLSRREDQTGGAAVVRNFRTLSGIGAVLYGISIHFASVDWTMSLQPVFHSTIWGPLFASGQLLSAMALALVVLAIFVRRPPLADVTSSKVHIDLASLLLTLLILWAYLAWFQFMLVWIANMPVDVVWYLPRTALGWKLAMGVIALFGFTIPFFLLLMRRIKRDPRAVAWIAGLILLMHYVYDCFQVMADPPAVGVAGYWMCILMPIGMGGVWAAYFGWQLARQSLLAPHDYNCAAAVHLRRLDEEEAARQEAPSYG